MHLVVRVFVNQVNLHLLQLACLRKLFMMQVCISSIRIFIYSFFFVELPSGVVNFVFGIGPRIGQALITHPDVNVISFTGSTAIGYHIKKATAHLPVKLSLEV